MIKEKNFTIEGIPIDYIEISDTFETNIAQFDIAFQNGARIINIGQATRTLKCTCYFYAKTYTRHVELLKLLEKNMIEVIPINSISSQIKYVSGLPGRVISAVTGVIERCSVLLTTIRDVAPLMFLNSLEAKIYDVINSLQPSTRKSSTKTWTALDEMSIHLSIQGVMRMALDLSYALSLDEKQRQDISVRDISTSVTDSIPILSADEIQTSVDKVRAKMQAVIENIQLNYDDPFALQVITSIKETANSLSLLALSTTFTITSLVPQPLSEAGTFSSLKTKVDSFKS